MSFSWFFWPIRRRRFSDRSDQAEPEDQTQINEHKKEKKKWSKKIWKNIFRKKSKKDDEENLQEGAGEDKVLQKPEEDGTGVESANAENISAGTVKNWMLGEPEMMINQHHRENKMLHGVDAEAKAEVMNVQTEDITQDAENKIIIKAENGENVVSCRRFSDQAEPEDQTQIDERKKEKKKWSKKIWKNIFRKKSKKDGEGNLQEGAGEDKVPQKPEEDGTGVEPANAENISAGTIENWMLDEPEMMINQHQRKNKMLDADVDAEAEAEAPTKVMNVQTEDITQDAENEIIIKAETGENVVSRRRFSDQAEPEDQTQITERQKEKKRSKKKRKNDYRKKSKKDGKRNLQEGAGENKVLQKPEEDGTCVEPANAENISAGTIKDIQEPKNFLLDETETINQHQRMNEMLDAEVDAEAEAETPTKVMNVQTENITQDAENEIITKAENGENVVSRDDPGSNTDDAFKRKKKTRRGTRGRERKMNYKNNNNNIDEVENEIPGGTNTGAEAEAQTEMTEAEKIFTKLQIIDEEQFEGLIRVMKNLLEQKMISRQILEKQIADMESSNKRNNAGLLMNRDNIKPPLDGENVINRDNPANNTEDPCKKKTRKGRRGRKCNNKKNNKEDTSTSAFKDQTNASEATATIQISKKTKPRPRTRPNEEKMILKNTSVKN
ncbi:uncharacterized protein DDB_G0287625-like [Trichomycterus rosablanca]|uniref:uncharacterized protein DDB_G0287625-like n=1 Tax=Trichomycterus rosablanca TaxID=2290929 RepID=UPI002F3560B9